MENKKKGELTRVKFYTETNKVKNEKKKKGNIENKDKNKTRGVIKCKCLRSY